MRRIGGIVLVATLAIVPILPLPTLLLSSSSPDASTVTARPVHDYDAPKWFAGALALVFATAAAWVTAAMRRRAGTKPAARHDGDATPDTFLLAPGARILVALGVFAAVSAAWATARGAALEAASHVFLLAGLFTAFGTLLGAATSRLDAIRLLFGATAGAGSIVAIYGIAQRAGIDFAALPWRDARRAVSTLGNTNFASEFLVVAIPAIAATALVARHAAIAACATVAAGVAVLHLLLTETRAGWVALTAGALFAIALYAIGRRGQTASSGAAPGNVSNSSARGDSLSPAPSPGTSSHRTRTVALAIAAVAACFALALPWFDGGSVAKKAVTLVDADHPSTRVRVHLWSSTIDMITDHPFVGVGAGNFAAEYPLYRRSSEIELSGYLSGVETAHNDWLQIAAELGVPGILLWVAFAAIVLACGVRGTRRIAMRDPTGSRLVVHAAAGASTVAFFTNAAFRSPLDNPAALVTFAAAAAIFATGGSVTASRVARPRRSAPLAIAVVACLLAAWWPWTSQRADVAIRRAIAEQDAASRLRQPAEVESHLMRARDALASVAEAASTHEVAFRLGQVESTLASLHRQVRRTDEERRAIEQARNAFETALARRPNDVAARVNLAVQLAKLGDLEAAERELAAAESIAPNDPRVHANRGLVFVTQERYGEAALAFERASGLRPRHRQTLENLVLAYERLLAGPTTSPVYLPLLENARARLTLVQALDAIDDDRPEDARRLLERTLRETAAPPPELVHVLRRLTSISPRGTSSDDSNPSDDSNAAHAELPESSWIHRDPTVRSLDSMSHDANDSPDHHR